MAAFTPGIPIETDVPAITVDGLPPGPHTFRLVVVDEAGNASLPSLAKVDAVDPAPKLTGFSPAFGQPGDAVALFGSNLENGADRALFGNLAAPITALSPTRIDTVVPAGAVTAPIRVSNPKGSAVTPKPFVVPRLTVTRKLPSPVDADHDPVAGELWVSGNGAAGTAASSFVFALSLPDGRLKAAVAVGPEAGDIAVSRSAELRVGLVANTASSSATVFSLDGRKVSGVVRLKSNPDGVAVSPDGTRGLAAIPATGQVAVIDMQAIRVLATLEVGRLPSKVGFARAGGLAFVNCAGEGALVGIDVRNLTLAGRFQVGGSAASDPVQFADTASGFPVWTANAGNGTVSLATSATQVGTVSPGLKPSALAADAGAKTAFAAGFSEAALARIEAAGLGVESVRLPAPAGGYRSVAVTRDGGRVAVAHPKGAAASFVDGASLGILAVAKGFSAPSRVIATDDDALFCILDPQGLSVALLDIGSLG